tara:strand:- start:3296 stop:3640 length:345 start_codon:yes stop_codon:yes gene_type:complete
MIQKLVSQIPTSDVFVKLNLETQYYTKQEVNQLIADAVAEARRIDEESMRKHNRDATIISMILGFTTLALFVDGLLRMLGIIPPFMNIDVDILEKIVQRVESDISPILQRLPRR